MPKDFEACKKAGGEIRTITGPNKKYGLKYDEYCHVCIRKGQFIRGEVKHKSEQDGETAAAKLPEDGPGEEER